MSDMIRTAKLGIERMKEAVNAMALSALLPNGPYVEIPKTSNQ